jgi:hypothetical protein
MLDALLEKLGGLLPKNFIIAAFFPVLLFAGANGVMCYLTVPRFREWAGRYAALDAGQQAFYGIPVLIVVAVAAYIFSMLNLSLRRALEGEPPLLPDRVKDWLKRQLTVRQRHKLRRLEAQLKESERFWWRLKRLVDGKEGKGDGLESILTKAYTAGTAQAAACDYAPDKSAAAAVAELAKRREENREITAQELSDAVGQLAAELGKCNVGRQKPGDPDYENKRELNEDFEALREVIRYAVSRAEEEYATRYNQREYNYSRYKLSPTTMGNVAESVRGYARSRYAMNLDPFWLRVQKLVLDDKDFYASLLDAKTQLDFLVSLCWLTAAFTAFWLVYLLYLRQSVWLFLGIGLAGPALAFMWYKIAVQSYLAFADVLRTVLDLYRFKLLDALNIKRPANRQEEQKTWRSLSQVIGYGGADPLDYKAEAKEAPPKTGAT